MIFGLRDIEVNLEALAVHDRRTRLIILLLRDPHLLEGGQRGQDGATDPYRVLPLGRSNDLDLHGGGGQGCDLLLHSVSNTWVHSGASRQNSVSIQILPDINITLHDRVVSSLMNTTRLHAKE